MEKLIPIIAVAVGIIAVVAVLVSGYVKASPDVAVIISGLTKTPRVLIGRAGVKVPWTSRRIPTSRPMISSM